jgi:hypothetical protein
MASPTEALRELQGLLIGAVLRGEILPGGDQPLSFPDLPFVLREPEVFVLDQNLAGPLTVRDAPKPVRVVSIGALREEARPRGEVAYLRFGEAETEDDLVRMTLEALVATEDPDRRPMGLAGMSARFERVNGSWKLVEPPVFMAM